MKETRKRSRRGLWLFICTLLLLGAAFLLGRIFSLRQELPSQQAAERWRGESETPFSQVSCFLTVDAPTNLNGVYGFRTAMLEELHKAALDGEGSDGLWLDSWSTRGSLTVASSRASASCTVTPVGGSFFTFHPLRLLSGSYLAENDLMKDLVLIDEELAWLLYGGTELQGMTLELNGEPFVIGGVIEREQDSFSRAAYTEGQGLYMSYDAYVRLTGDDSISCYEIVLPEPVEGFALQVVKDKFPLGEGEAVQNTGRFSPLRLYKLIGKLDSRAMQQVGLSYPYWENAARAMETHCARLLAYAALLLILPLLTALWLLWLGLKGLFTGLTEKLLPRAAEGVGEAVRVQQRKRWEKKEERKNRQ